MSENSDQNIFGGSDPVWGGGVKSLDILDYQSGIREELHNHLNPQTKTEVPKPPQPETVPENVPESPVVLDKYATPKNVVEHINNMIRLGRPLKSLVFDMQYASSSEEVMGYIKASTQLSVEEKSHILSMFGMDGSAIDSIEDKETALMDARREYALAWSDYIKTSNKKSLVYSELMSQLGVQKQMPKLDLPKDLAQKRDKYFTLRGDTSFDTEEVRALRDEIFSSLEDRDKVFVLKAMDLFDRSTVEARALVGGVLIGKEDLPERHGLAQPVDIPVPKNPEISINTEVPKPGSFEEGDIVFPMNIMGKKVELVQYIKDKTKFGVYVDGVLVAEGGIAEDGPKVVTLPSFRSSPLAKPTTEEEVLIQIMPVINTLKI